MSDFVIFVVGIIVTLVTGMGVITSQVFLGYANSKPRILEVEPEYAVDKSA